MTMEKYLKSRKPKNAAERRMTERMLEGLKCRQFHLYRDDALGIEPEKLHPKFWEWSPLMAVTLDLEKDALKQFRTQFKRWREVDFETLKSEFCEQVIIPSTWLFLKNRGLPSSRTS